MVKLSAHFKKGCSKFTRYGQTHCTLQLSVQWDHQTWSNSMHTSVKCAVSLITWNFVSRCGSTFDAIHGQTHCTLQLSLQWLCSLGILWADVGKCFWNTEVHVYMETSGSDARSLFEKRCVSSEMTNCTCCMQKLAAAGRIQQGMCTWKLIVLMQASKEKTEICYR